MHIAILLLIFHEIKHFLVSLNFHNIEEKSGNFSVLSGKDVLYFIDNFAPYRTMLVILALSWKLSIFWRWVVVVCILFMMQVQRLNEL